MTDATDAQLIAAAREGNPEAYGDLVARYQGHVYGLAYSPVNNWADGQDIAQETFVRAYVNLHQLKDPERFAPWLRRVTFSVAMNWIKTFRPSYFAQLDGQVDLEKLEVPDFTPGLQEVVERKELAEAVQRAVQSLPPRYRVPLTMFHLDGLSYDKVASFLDVPLGTAKSLIQRARAKLKEALGSYFAEELTPVVQEVFTAHKLTPQFAQKVLKALEIYQQVEEETKRYHQPRDLIIAPLVCMRAAGWVDVDYETLAVLSGAGASFAYHPQHYWVMYRDVFLPPNDPQELTARATGFGWERLPKVSSAEKAWEIVKKTLDRGSPIVGHFYDQLVFVGYEDAAEKAQRKVCVGGGFDALGWWDWARFEEWATQWGHFGRYSGEVPRLAPERAPIEVMRGVLQCV